MEGRTRKAGQYGSSERSKTRAEAPPLLKHAHQLLQQSQPQQPGRKIPVVYYLCRNRHLEHPHFIEVPASSPEGLYLRDVISRLNVLRGKGMAAMYSWSCKRSYKNGFVWHDLSEDDLILPSNGNEYVLKGSELLDTSPSDRPLHHAAASTWSQAAKHHLQQETPLPSRSLETSPSSSGAVVIKEVKPPPPPPQRQLQHPSLPPPPLPASAPEDELQLSPTLRRRSFSSRNISPDSQLNPPWGAGGCSPPGLAEYKVYKASGAADASTQTEDKGGRARRDAAPPPPPPCTRTMGVSTDDGALELDFDEARGQLRTSSEISGDEISPPPTSSSASSSGGKTETLESLIRADARKMSNFRILEEEDEVLPPVNKLRATDVLMQLITCGSISVKDHHSFGLYKPRFSQVSFPSPVFSSSRIRGELECLSENPRMVGLRALEDKEYFSGSLIETKKHRELAEAELVPALKRSSSYNADRSCKSPDPIGDKAKATDAARSKCLPRTIKITSNRHPKNETMKSPLSDGPRISSAGPDGTTRSKGGSKRFNDTAASLKGSSLRLESFREDKEKVIKIEERLTSGARVVIHSTAPCEDSEDSSSS